MNSPLDEFGLPPEADEREIKRAYAKRLRTVRPDEDPAGFQQLHEMYQRALAWRVRTASMAMVPCADEEEDAEEAEYADEAATPVDAPQLPHVPSAAPAPHMPPVPDTHGAWRPVPFAQAPAAAAPAPPQPFDLPAFIESYMKVAPLGQPRQLKSWLHEQPALWSLQVKQHVGRALIQRLLGEVPPIDAASMDATLDFFDLEHTQSGVDALHLHQLRGLAQERYELVKRHSPSMQAWGANAQWLDMDGFFAWLSAQALAGDRAPLEAALCVQPALRNFAVRQAAARPLFERLWLERPPMPAACAWLLIQFFGLRPLLAQAGQTPQDFAARLEIGWLMQERNKNALASVTKDPKKPYPMPNQAWHDLQRLRQPFRWWWIAFAALIPNRLSSLGRFALRLCDGNLHLLDSFFDPRLTRFCIAAAERFLVTRPRVIVGAIRCAALLLAATLLYVSVDAQSDRNVFPIMAGIATAAWAYYLVFLLAWRWQQQPEQPVTPRPLLRIAFVPLLALGAFALYSFGHTYDGEPLRFPALLLAVPAIALGFLRWRARNPARRSFLSKLPDTLVGVLVIIVAVLLLSDARLPAAGALLFWMLDLFKQRKQLRWR
ncbi:J domain-containing protein [Dyella sp. 2RAB6]|uniref:J domain-containing protein n=1 Tax=Dyella sp. 2RAB6 TaxID=3232992 RepID=UPI003F90E0A0